MGTEKIKLPDVSFSLTIADEHNEVLRFIAKTRYMSKEALIRSLIDDFVANSGVSLAEQEK